MIGAIAMKLLPSLYKKEFIRVDGSLARPAARYSRRGKGNLPCGYSFLHNIMIYSLYVYEEGLHAINVAPRRIYGHGSGCR